MKKSIIAVGVLLLLAALLPILGNSFMKKTIDDRVTQLKEYGLETKKDEANSSYLSSERHIEFVLKDSKKFIDYLSTFADTQPPAYVSAMFNGVVLGVDIKYSNLPFAKASEIEIFPLTLSDEIRASLKQNDANFLKYLQAFLQSKGIVYHINYNAVSNKFDGYIKDINQKYTLKDGTKIDLGLSKATFDGKGALVAPEMMNSKIKAFHLNVVKNTETFDMSLAKFTSSANFNSKSTYLSTMAVDAIDVNLSGTADDVELHTKKLKFNASSNAQGKDAQLNAKTSFDLLNIESKKLNMDLKKFDFDLAVNGLDKVKYEALRKLLADEANQQASLANQDVQKAIVDLVSNGFVIKLAQCSLEAMTLDQQTKLNGFDVKSELIFTADKDLAQKIKLSPMMAGSDVEFNSEIKIARELYTYLTTKSPMLGNIVSYAEEKNGNYVFNIKIKDTKATVNGKPLN